MSTHMTACNVKELEDKLTQLRSEKKSVEVEMSELSDLLKMLNMQASTRARLDLVKRDCKKDTESATKT